MEDHVNESLEAIISHRNHCSESLDFPLADLGVSQKGIGHDRFIIYKLYLEPPSTEMQSYNVI